MKKMTKNIIFGFVVIGVISLTTFFFGSESVSKFALFVAASVFCAFIVILAKPLIAKQFANKDSDEEKSHQRPKDIHITTRNRSARVIVLAVWVVLLAIIPTFGLEWFVSNFFTETPKFISQISWTVGFSLGVGAIIATINIWFIIRNPTTGMFMTIDILQSIIGGSDVNVSYGPGNHICFPWEKRLESNNISLEEATNEFTFKVQCIDGTLEGTGAFWARPDMNNALNFLTGVAAFAEDMENLIIAEIATLFSQKKVMVAINELTNLNEKLKKEFVDGESETEIKFGIHLGDVVIKQLLPSDELQRTISAKAEAEAIKDGTLSLLGAKSWTQVQAWIRKGTVTQADISLARDRFLSISGNLEGMEIKRSEIDVSLHGLDKDVVDTIAKALSSPAAIALASKVGETDKK